ncbi:MAG: hypothetical protein ABL998_02605, partial [Planctomycetota bacterium]
VAWSMSVRCSGESISLTVVAGAGSGRLATGGSVVAALKLMEERGARRVRKEVTLTRADGSARAWREDVRLYEPAEIAALLAEAGLELLRSEGDFDGSAFGPETPRQIVWARRRAAGA